MKNKIYILIVFLTMGMVSLLAQENVTVDDIITGKATVTAPQSITLKQGFHAVEGSQFHAYIDTAATSTPISTAYLSKSVSGTPSSTGHNYIRSITFREAYSDTTQDINNYAHNEEIQYFDGLGRPNQVIQVNASPNGFDIVQPIVYDEFGREAKKFLPYAVSTNSESGLYRSNDTTACKTFYSASGGIVGKEADAEPFFITNYEPSPLNRVESQLGVGLDWHTNNKTIDYTYTTNTDDISSWDENGEGITYPKNSLFVTEVVDENESITKEYKDKLGQVILKEAINGEETLQTFYIYDDFGLLRTVVPPLADSPSDSSLCYFYTYDSRKRMITKKIPGADPVNMVYDRRDRLVLTQDGNMHEENSNKYLFTKYDQLNRPVLTGTVIASKELSALRTDFNNYGDESSETLYEEYQGRSYQTSWGYTYDQSFPSSCKIDTTKILTATWYDDSNYSFITDLELNNKLDFSSSDMPSGYDSIMSTKTKGAIIGTMIKALPVSGSGLTLANTKLVTVPYYDDYGNVIMSVSTNHKDGIDRFCTLYKDITHEVSQTTQVHSVPGQDDLTVTKEFDYDHMGRLLETRIQVNTQDKIVLNQSRYNELGELVTKYLHSEDASTSSSKEFVQEVNYTYNVRGWLTSINDPDLSANSDNDLFGMKLYYNNISGLNTTSVPISSKQYNGNISAMVCSTLGDDVVTKGYGFSYDPLNRLTASRYGEGVALSDNQGKYNVTISNYDKNGNIINLDRYFKGDLVDGLTYTYRDNNRSNQIESVVDTGVSRDSISDYMQGTGTYSYDLNGNMKHDPAKGTDIAYNYLNLPQSVKINDDQKIFYHYDATGNKLAKYVEDNTSSDKTTDYIANIVYTDGQQSFFSTEEGRAVPIVSGGNTTWHLEYTLKDHLGNTRVTFGGSQIPGGADIVQTSSYYPFGMVMTQKNYNTSGTNYQQNKYLYNGKEIQDDVLGGVSLGLYDYGARMYDPALGRFMTQDAYAEKYISMTPYQYGANNPIKYIDVNGDSTYLVIWATEDGNIGHAGVAVDNYQKDEDGNYVTDENGNYIPDGTVTYYDLWPATGVGKDNADQDVTPYYGKTVTTLDAVMNTDVTGSEGYAPDGVVSLGTDFQTDQNVMNTMESTRQDNKDYNGYYWNCSTFAREGVNSAAQSTGQYGVSGVEIVGGKFSVTPNQLYNETRGLQNATVLKDPGNKVNHSFIEGVRGKTAEKMVNKTR